MSSVTAGSGCLNAWAHWMGQSPLKVGVATAAILAGCGYIASMGAGEPACPSNQWVVIENTEERHCVRPPEELSFMTPSLMQNN